jgi:hypothetical protein
MYAIAMGVDALAALLLGRLFDKHGIKVLIGSTLLSLLFALWCSWVIFIQLLPEWFAGV